MKQLFLSINRNILLTIYKPRLDYCVTTYNQPYHNYFKKKEKVQHMHVSQSQVQLQVHL